jgi:hypothetical protein
MTKETSYFIENFNIINIAKGFCWGFTQNIGGQFKGYITLVIFDRKMREVVDAFWGIRDLVLDGWMPDMEEKKTKYDFYLAPDVIIPCENIINLLKENKLLNKVDVLRLEIASSIVIPGNLDVLMKGHF